MSVSVNGDLSGIQSFAGGVKGMLEAMEEPGFKGDFVRYSLNQLKKEFRNDTIAQHAAGNASIKHVFEWNSAVPLFRLDIRGGAGMQYMTYSFLPSTTDVPLPEGYGIKQSVLDNLTRHKFVLKALVMETQSRVTIAPRLSKMLFIPTRENDRGYVMTRKPVELNPGGEQATGGFATWWTTWFAGPAQAHLEKTQRTAEDVIEKTGRKVIRYAAGTVINGEAVGGQFATGRKVTFGYAQAAERNAKLALKIEANRTFDTRGEEDE